MKKTRKNVQGLVGILFSLMLTMGLMSVISMPVSAADILEVDYEYSTEVVAGTIRYISQNDGKTNNASRNQYFDDRYWGDYWLEPHYELDCSGPGAECGTASISMALSYVGINKTPQNILDTHNGQTVFTGWGADTLYPSLSMAMEHLENGNGKYSPAIIHFKAGAPGYPYGHFVLAIAKDGNTYTILDCNKDSMWTLSTGDSLYGYIDNVIQYYNKDAEIQPKLTIPENVTPTNLQLKVTATKTVPARTGAGKKYAVAKKLTNGDVVTAVGYVKNTYNNLWYFLSDGTYVYSGSVEVAKCLSTARITGQTVPAGTLTYGKVFVLKGTVSGANVRNVTVRIKDSNGNIVLKASEKVEGEYSLQGSSIDKAMTFNTLPRGNYVYEIVVTENGDTGVVCTRFDTTICSSNFTIA